MVIRPDYVLVSGDLAMGYHKKLESASQEHQWLFYESLWKYQNYVPRERWIDIPGNHDFTMKELSQQGKDITDYTATSWNNRFLVIPYDKSSCLLGVDFTYSPRTIQITGWLLDVPYWINSFGYATSSDLKEIEAELINKQYIWF